MRNEATPTSIFEFARFSEYLSAYVKWRKVEQPNYSYMVLARQIGSKTPSLLTQIGLGRRHPTPALLIRLKKALKLTKREHEYALALVGIQKAKSAEERSEYSEQLRRLKPSNPHLIQELDRQDFFARARNVVILEMFRLKDFKLDPTWIAGRLGDGSTALDVRESLALLERMGMLERDAEGALTTRLSEHASTPQNFPSATVRSYHRQMLQRAADALEAQSVDERYIAGTTIAVDGKRIAEAQEAIREFRRKFCEEFQATPGDQVYQVAIQLFRLTAKS